MELIDTLDKMGSGVNRKWPYINSGGCCVFASIVGKILQEKGIPVKGIVAAYSAQYKFKPIWWMRRGVSNNSIPEWERRGLDFNHVGIEFRYGGKKWHYHSKGAQIAGKSFDRMPIFRGRLTLDELIELAANEEGWNSAFDRRDIPAIEKYITTFLKKKKVVDSVPT
jgi:hypothetical protein